MELSDVIAAIDQMDDDEAKQVLAAIKVRRKTLWRRESAKVIGQFGVGDIVKVQGDVQPRHFMGVMGQITNVGDVNVHVRSHIDIKSPRKTYPAGTIVRVPAAALILVGKSKEGAA